MVNSGKITCNKECLLLGTHGTCFGRSVKRFSCNGDLTGFCINFYIIPAPLGDFFAVVITTGNTGRMVVKDFRKAAGFAAVLFQDMLPQGRAAAYVVSGTGCVLKRQIVCLTFHRFGHQLGRAHRIYQGGANHRSVIGILAGVQGRKQGKGQSFFHSCCRMILLSVAHLVGDNKGQFVFIIIQLGKGPNVDAHVVAQGAESIKGLIIIHKIVVGLFHNGVVRKGHCIGQPRHNAGQHGVGGRVGVDAVLVFDLAHVIITAFVVQIVDLFIQIGVLGSYLEYGQPGGQPVPGQGFFGHYCTGGKGQAQGSGSCSAEYSGFFHGKASYICK